MHLNLCDMTPLPYATETRPYASTPYNTIQAAIQINGRVCLGIKKLLRIIAATGSNHGLTPHFTSDIHEAYQHQINSKFLVTHLGIKPGTIS